MVTKQLLNGLKMRTVVVRQKAALISYAPRLSHFSVLNAKGSWLCYGPLMNINDIIITISNQFLTCSIQWFFWWPSIPTTPGLQVQIKLVFCIWQTVDFWDFRQYLSMLKMCFFKKSGKKLVVPAAVRVWVTTFTPGGCVVTTYQINCSSCKSFMYKLAIGCSLDNIRRSGCIIIYKVCSELIITIVYLHNSKQTCDSLT